MMVTSRSPGRIRVRDRCFRSAFTIRETEKRLLSLPGILEVTGSPIAGSFLIRFSEQSLTDVQILAALHEGDPPDLTADPAAAHRIPSRTGMRSWVICGMKLVFGLSIGAAFTHFRWLHVQTGIVFLGLTALHVAQNSGR